MAHPAQLREQAERCRRLARGSIDLDLHDSLLRLAEEFATRADSEDASDAADRQAGCSDEDVP
jgi:hypothetical protein